MTVFSVFAWLTDLVSGHWWTYGLVLGIALLDADVPVFPSETVVILAGIVAADGGLHLWLVVLCGWIGVAIGDNVSYLLGSRIGEPAYRRIFKGASAQHHYEWARRVLGAHGVWIVPASRFVPGGRTATTFAAGAVGMRWRTFFLADLVAGLVWALYGSLLGYLGGRTFTSSSWKSFALAFGVAGLIALAGVVYWRLSERREAR